MTQPLLPGQVTLVCEWCQHPLVLTLRAEALLSPSAAIEAITAALLLHKRVGCVYSLRARALA